MYIRVISNINIRIFSRVTDRPHFDDGPKVNSWMKYDWLFSQIMTDKQEIIIINTLCGVLGEVY